MKRVKMPREVSLAVKLLWISFGLGIVGNIVGFSDSLKTISSQNLGAGFLILTTLISLAIFAFFIYMISEGKNWARIIFSILVIIGVLFVIFNLSSYVSTMNPISAIFSIITLILELIAVFYLFKKTSSQWFNPVKKRK